MKSAEDIKRYFQKSTLSTNPEKHEAIFEKIQCAQDQLKTTTPASYRLNLRRKIMKSPITKLSAATVIIIAVLTGIFLLDNSTTGVAWGEVLEKAEQIPTVIFDTTVEITYSESEKHQFQAENYVAADYGIRVNIYHNGELGTIQYKLPHKKVVYVIRPLQKKYKRKDLSDEQVALGHDRDDPRMWVKAITSGDYSELGRADINGVIVEGIETKITGEANGVMRLWVDVETNLPVRIEVEELGMESGQMRPHKFVMDNFQWDVELDESVFEPNIPPDYEQM